MAARPKTVLGPRLLTSVRAGIVSALVLAVACSSTGTLDGASDTPRPGAEANSQGGPTGVAPEEARDPVTGEPITPAAPGGAGSGPRGRDGSGSGASGADPGRRTGGAVEVGLHYDANLDAAFAAFGAQRPEEDIEVALRAIVEDVNKRGGLGGRTIEPVFMGTDPLQDTYEQKAQQACSFFTEDHAVFTVISAVRMQSSSMVDCLAKKQTPFVWEYSFMVDEAMHERHRDFLYQPAHLTADRLAIFIDGLAARGYFGNAPTIGLVRYDTDPHKRFRDQVVKPRLADHGLTLAEDAAITPPPSASAAGDTSAQINNAILRFRTQNVTHVLFAPTGGVLPFVWMPAAESQAYRPRYGLTSMDGLNFLIGNVPKAQLERSMAIGWWPGADVAPADAPQYNAAEQRCFDVIDARAGDAWAFCDGLFFLQEATRDLPDLSYRSLRGAVEGLGERFVSPRTFLTRFGPTRHVGPAKARLVEFQSGCQCYRYVGAMFPLP